MNLYNSTDVISPSALKAHRANWHKVSSVRTGVDNYRISIDDPNKLFTLTSLLPAPVRHLDKHIGQGLMREITGLYLLEFLVKTRQYEIEFINQALLLVVEGNSLGLVFSDDVISDALKIYTDEGYHSLFSHSLASQLKEFLPDYQIVTESLNNYFSSLRAFVCVNDPVNRWLAYIALAIVGESTVVKDLSDQMNGIVYDEISQMFKDHIKDEVFHAAFFDSLLHSISSQMSSDLRNLFSEILCKSMILLSQDRRIALNNYVLSKYNGITVQYTASCVNQNTVKSTYSHLINSMAEANLSTEFLDNAELYEAVK